MESSMAGGVPGFFREFVAERDEILRHKWVLSERVGHDVGFENALMDWVLYHRGAWRNARRAHPRAS